MNNKMINEELRKREQVGNKSLNKPTIIQHTEQLVVNCNYCGRLYPETMCKLHPAQCKL